MRKYNQENFQELVDKALENPNLATVRPVVDKEFLHYDLLYVLDREGLLDGLAFQGGTAVRLCYGGRRFSEDLDFACGTDFTSMQLVTMKECILDYLTDRYGLEVTVKEPKSLRNNPAYADRMVDMWQIAVTTAPEQRDVPKQRIKLDMASIEAYTGDYQPLVRNYDFLPDGYEDILIFTEDKSEIMADKLVSLPATQTHVRHRDIWDLAYLSQERATLRSDLVEKKLADYKIEDFDAKLQSTLDNLPGIIDGKPFRDEMSRFLPADVYDRTFSQAKFSSFLKQRVSGLLMDLQDAMNPDLNQSDEPGFRM